MGLGRQLLRATQPPFRTLNGELTHRFLSVRRAKEP